MAVEVPKEKIAEIARRVTRYFSDFLTTDFKRSQAPRRRIALTTETGFRAGMRVSPYPALDRDLWALLGKPCGEELAVQMAPRRYTRPISATLSKVIREQVRAIPESAVATVRAAVLQRAMSTYAKAVENPEAWIEAVQSELDAEISTQIIRPLIAHLDGPLRQQAYWVMDSLHSAEADLIARVGGDLSGVLPDALAALLADGEADDLELALDHFLTLEAAQESLLSFFENFVAADAFLEFRDLETYIANSGGMQLYLYIGTIKHRSVQYPLFFLPVQVERAADGASYNLRLINHLFAHRAAIDFVLEQLATGMAREWVSPIKDRINYLTPEQSVFEVARTLFRRVANAIDLGGQIDLSSTAVDAQTTNVGLSSALYLAAYDTADESMLNDYEEILDQAMRGGSEVVDLFNGLVDQIINGNAKSVRTHVEDTWDALPMVDRLVDQSPIPLNEEQRKVLLAVDAPDSKIIVVEGPPGTGKSHTITAIAAHCAFSGLSCMVLSDKTEALDVVQEKLDDAMSRARHDRSFPNPILRLGQTNQNFRKLTSTSTMTQITAYAKATKQGKGKLEVARSGAEASLKAAIDATVDVLGSVALQSIERLHRLEAELGQAHPGVLAALQDMRGDPQSQLVVDTLKNTDLDVAPLVAYLHAACAPGTTPDSLAEKVLADVSLRDFAEGRSFDGWAIFEFLEPAQVRVINDVLVQYQQLRMPVFGYLFRGSAVRALELQVNALATNRPVLLKTDAPLLQKVVAGGNALRQKLEAESLGGAFVGAYKLFAAGNVPHKDAGKALQLMQAIQSIYPDALPQLTAQADAQAWSNAVGYIREWLITAMAFENAPQFDYIGQKSVLERMNTAVLNTHVDGRLIDFMDNHRADAKALSAVISNRGKFPEDKFAQVRDSFPVILASIREFGEFMPLVPGLFDVLVIDEASQVSVAQALPAVLRAKKVIVLGDSKQFSNVKSANASNQQNEKYRAELDGYFSREVTTKADVLQRLAMFDVKRSILEFCTASGSYTTMLTKHFRSYPELIGYSSSTFYNGQLQALKIRGVPMDEVIRFDQVSVPENSRVTRGVNEAEGDYILERLLELVDSEDPPTVGVITPFREQQTFLTKLLFNHPRGRDFEDVLRLRVFTFDSCQGHEKQVVIYSMVATPGNDALSYIFPVNMDNAVESVEEKLKLQRLNVGFSRAQEMVWFVHSMPLANYRGSIGQAMAYYANALESRTEIAADLAESPMEAKVIDWLQQTTFYQANSDSIEVTPQFPIGDYLRQLDPTYEHPSWRVDFLLTYQGDRGPVQIVIEYDGFREHFQTAKNIHEGNHDRYLNAGDVERQLTLESYGYRFLRINRFNLGKDPVTTLSNRLYRLIEVAGGDPISASVQQIQSDVAGLLQKDKKACAKCGKVHDLDKFFDQDLKGGQGGHGRICMDCKRPGAAASATFRNRRFSR
ncbi:AAA domain-containing protein [Stenotrophomonas maltophilia]|uniref:AAA domain-containing protein n=1 Tax=Stenotrophomonas maltophilia TaxID=40324 RepID=UPI0039C03ADA